MAVQPDPAVLALVLGDGPATELLPGPRTTPRSHGVPVDYGQCGGCGQAAELRWDMTPMDDPALRGTIFICRPCGRRVLAQLQERLPDLGVAPLRGYG